MVDKASLKMDWFRERGQKKKCGLKTCAHICTQEMFMSERDMYMSRINMYMPITLMTVETNNVQITWPRDLSSMSSMSSTLASQHELRAHQSSLTTQILGPASGLQHGRRTKQMPRHDQKSSLEKPFQAKGPRKVPWYLTSVAILLAQEHSTSQRSSQDTYLNTLLKTAFVLT